MGVMEGTAHLPLHHISNKLQSPIIVFPPQIPVHHHLPPPHITPLSHTDPIYQILSPPYSTSLPKPPPDTLLHIINLTTSLLHAHPLPTSLNPTSSHNSLSHPSITPIPLHLPSFFFLTPQHPYKYIDIVGEMLSGYAPEFAPTRQTDKYVQNYL